MCLITRQVKPKVFTKDTVFYKVLYQCGEEYYTPYTDSKVIIGEDICADGKGVFIPKGAKVTVKYNQVLAGYIHLLRKRYEAGELKLRLINYCAPFKKELSTKLLLFEPLCQPVQNTTVARTETTMVP